MGLRTRRFIPLSELRDSVPPDYHKDFLRASGEGPCEVCGQPLWKHEQPLEESCPTMVEDCAGNWWKL